MLDNRMRRELLTKARQSGFPGSILDVYSAYEQGKDIIAEYEQQQKTQQTQQMSDLAAQQSGMTHPQQQMPQMQEMPQMPSFPPSVKANIPQPPPSTTQNLVNSEASQPVGMATNKQGQRGGQLLLATGGFKTDPPFLLPPMNTLKPVEVKANRFDTSKYPDLGINQPLPTYRPIRKSTLEEEVYWNQVPDWYKKWGKDDITEDVIEFLDPTGIVSHDDAKRAYDSWKESGRKDPTPEEGLEMFGAVPALGKFGKIKYVKKLDTKEGVKSITKHIPWQQILNTVGFGKDIYEQADGDKKEKGGFETGDPEKPMAKNGGTKKVKIQSLSKPPKKGLTWGEYLKKRGITDKDILSLGQDQIDSTFNRSIVGDYKKFPEIFKQDTDGKLDIKNQIYNEYLNSLISDYNDVYPISDNGNRITVSNIVSKKGWRDPEIFGLTDEQYYQVGAAASLDNADSEKFIDMYFKNQDKYNTMNLEKEGKGYRDVPVKWVDAYPKYSLKGIDAYNPESPGEFRRDSRNLFRYPVLYDDKILGKQDIPLLGADWMRNYYKKAGTKHFTTRSSRDDHNNPAIYPKPNYSMEEVNPVLSGSPNYGSNFRINGQDYTIAQPDQNYIQNQFYGLPISAMPGPSAENIYVDSPNSDWVRNYKNKMNLYNVTQENLARLKEYDPNYILDTAPLTEDDRRVVGYENQYINDPSVGFYQTDPNEEIKEPCESCGTLYGSTKTGDADTTYQTYDVQYPQYGVFKKEDLDPKPRYYIERSGEYGNPGVAHIYRANLTDPTNPQNRDYLGAVLADEWLSGDTLENFYGSGYQYREPIDYEGLKDGRRVWREGTENWDELEPYAILDQRAKEPAERGARERYKKKMQEFSDMQVGDPETESRRQQYVKEKLGKLNNFINDLGNPRARGRDYSGPSFQKGGQRTGKPATAADSLQIASHADQVANFYRNNPIYSLQNNIGGFVVDHPYEGSHKGYGYVNIPNRGAFEIDYRSGKPELKKAPVRFMDGGSSNCYTCNRSKLKRYSK